MNAAVLSSECVRVEREIRAAHLSGRSRDELIAKIEVSRQINRDERRHLARVVDQLEREAYAEAEAAAKAVESARAAALVEQLDELGKFIRRFVVLTDAQTAAIALWVLHTHAVDAADITPYLAVTSAEKRSGKTRLLEVLELLVASPMPTLNISDAALFRMIGNEETPMPTLLFDEIDAIFGPKARDREDLRGLLNAGYRRGAVVHRMGGAKMTSLEEFAVFCPKAFAGIGDLPDTIADRCIRIRLARKARTETTERFRRREVAPEADRLRAQAATWASAAVATLRDARPALPDELDDRAQDVWEPLLAIAELAGSDRAAEVRRVAVELSTAEAREDDSLGIRLLGDARRVFDNRGTDRLPTAELIAGLAEDLETPWADWHGRGSIPPKSLATILKPYGIRSRSIRLETGETPKGFLREQFEDAWSRYLPSNTASSRHTRHNAENTGISTVSVPPHEEPVAASQEGENPRGYADVAGVAANLGEDGPGSDGTAFEATLEAELEWT